MVSLKNTSIMYDITPKNGQFEMPALPYSADAINVISAKTFEFTTANTSKPTLTTSTNCSLAAA